MKNISILISTGLLLAGCASVDEKTVAEPNDDKKFVTGSNLPQRDRTKSGVIVVAPESFEDSRNVGTSQRAPRTK